MRDGQIFFGSDRVRPEGLAAKINECLARGAKREVYIRADARARYGRVSAVLDGIRAAGVERVGILVDQKANDSCLGSMIAPRRQSGSLARYPVSLQACAKP